MSRGLRRSSKAKLPPFCVLGSRNAVRASIPLGHNVSLGVCVCVSPPQPCSFVGAEWLPF